ncbi:hypothetical protein ABRT01_01665 [Lentibacillus sp. L22]|uniref:hypothetical protein n=1 Tax=Lentibacillus TaxID=175304 RepID=UPI0022B09464|nr:hypothetical protein [Lentibacillus daqui]
MSDEKHEKHQNQKKDNFIKSTSKEATDLFGNTVDSAGRIIKTVSGEGGLVGKATDASGRILKGAAGKANDVIGKTSEAPGKLYKKARGNHEKKHKE